MLYGGVLALAALNPLPWALPLLLVVAGIAMSVSNTSANALLQTQADPLLRGRTVSLYMLALRGGASLGNLLAGVSVSLLGIRNALLLNGALAFLTHFLIGRQWLREAGTVRKGIVERAG